MRNILALALAVLVCLCLAGCELPQKQQELSDEQVVIRLLECFQAKDYEGIKPYISDDNPLHQLFSGAKQGGVTEAFQEAFFSGSDMTFTAQAVEGKEAWGTVRVTLSIPDHSEELYQAMVQALQNQVETGDGSFRNVAGWMKTGMEGSGRQAEETFELHVGNRDGNMVMDTNANRQFFAMLCGGLKPYLNLSLTTCTFPDGTVWELVAQGDELIAMASQEVMDGSDYDQETLAVAARQFEEAYGSVDGIYVRGAVEDRFLYFRLGVDLQSASSYQLEQLGILSGRLTAGSNGWISLESTVRAFTRQGASCVTQDLLADNTNLLTDS